MKKILLIPSLLLILIFITSCKTSFTKEDIEIKDFTYKEIYGYEGRSRGSYSPNQLFAKVSFVLSPKKELKNQYGIYDANHDKALNSEERLWIPLNRDLKQTVYLALDNLTQKPNIEFCFSNTGEGFIEKTEKHVVCKTQEFLALPKINASIEILEPWPLTIKKIKEIKKIPGTGEEHWTGTMYLMGTKRIIVKNTGNVLTYYMLTINIDGKDIVKTPFKTVSSLVPIGRTFTFVLGGGEFNLKDKSLTPGTHKTKGYLWSLSPSGNLKDALFKKEVIIKYEVK